MVRSFDDGKRSTLALSRDRDGEAKDRGAEVIDLVYLPSGARPNPRAELDYEEVEEAREMDCANYGQCLAFAAAAHWKGFHCRRCPVSCGTAGTDSEGAPQGGLARVIHFRR